MKKRIVRRIVILVLLAVLVLPLGSGYMTDGGTRFFTPAFIHWYMIYDHSTRRALIPIYPHDGQEHDEPTTKTVYGGIEVYLFRHKVIDSSYKVEVPIDS